MKNKSIEQITTEADKELLDMATTRAVHGGLELTGRQANILGKFLKQKVAEAFNLGVQHIHEFTRCLESDGWKGRACKKCGLVEQIKL